MIAARCELSPRMRMRSIPDSLTRMPGTSDRILATEEGLLPSSSSASITVTDEGLYITSVGRPVPIRVIAFRRMVSSAAAGSAACFAGSGAEASCAAAVALPKTSARRVADACVRVVIR